MASDVFRLVDLLYNNSQYELALLSGRRTRDKEKGQKTSKEVLCGQIWKELFPDDPSTSAANRVKTKLRWLEKQYTQLKKQHQGTGSGQLRRNGKDDNQHLNSRGIISRCYPCSSYDPERNRLPSRLAPQREDTALISDDNGTGPGRAIPPISSLVDESQTDPFARNLLFSGSVEPPSGPHTPAPVSRRRHRSLFFSGDDDVEDDVNGNNGVGYNAQEDNDDTQDGLDDTQEDSNSHRASCSNSPRPTPSTGSPRKTRSSPAQRRRNKQITDLVQACTGRSLEIRIRMEEEKTKREEMRFALKREEGERRERMREKEQEWLLQLIRLSRQGQRGSQDGSQNGFNLGPLLSLGNAEEAQF